MGADGERVAAALCAAVDDLLTAPIARYSREELLGLLAAVDTQLRRLAAVDATLIGELDQRHLAGELGAANTAGLLTGLLRVAPARPPPGCGRRGSSGRGADSPVRNWRRSSLWSPTR
jgi:hypothetical protein